MPPTNLVHVAAVGFGESATASTGPPSGSGPVSTSADVSEVALSGPASALNSSAMALPPHATSEDETKINASEARRMGSLQGTPRQSTGRATAELAKNSGN